MKMIKKITILVIIFITVFGNLWYSFSYKNNDYKYRFKIDIPTWWSELPKESYKANLEESFRLESQENGTKRTTVFIPNSQIFWIISWNQKKIKKPIIAIAYQDFQEKNNRNEILNSIYSVNKSNKNFIINKIDNIKQIIVYTITVNEENQTYARFYRNWNAVFMLLNTEILETEQYINDLYYMVDSFQFYIPYDEINETKYTNSQENSGLQFNTTSKNNENNWIKWTDEDKTTNNLIDTNWYIKGSAFAEIINKKQWTTNNLNQKSNSTRSKIKNFFSK